MYDAPLLEYDRSLPQLPRLLDAHAMAQLFTDRLWAWPGSTRRVPVHACAIEHVRHRHGKCCVLGYRVTTDLDSAGSTRELRFSARAYPPGRSQAAFDKACLERQTATPHGPPLFHEAGAGLIVWAFPNDRKLVGLRALGGIDGLRLDVLPRIASELRCDARALARAEVSLVHYVPEHGCTFRVATDAETFYAKCHLPGHARDSRALLDALWSGRPRREGRLRMPQPLLHQDRFDLLWTRGLEGRTLLHCWARDRSTADRFAAAGEVLAALHDTDEVPAPDITRTALVDKLHRVSQAARALAPASAAAITRIADRLERESHVLDSCEAVTLHGDLHPENILSAPTEAALLDFDSLAHGPAVLDLGSFSAAMRYHSLLAGGDDRATTSALESFLNAYEHASATTIDRRALRWSTAFALVAERAYRCMTRMKPGRIALVEALVTQADALVAPRESGRSTSRG